MNFSIGGWRATLQRRLCGKLRLISAEGELTHEVPTYMAEYMPALRKPFGAWRDDWIARPRPVCK